MPSSGIALYTHTECAKVYTLYVHLYRYLIHGCGSATQRERSVHTHILYETTTTTTIIIIIIIIHLWYLAQLPPPSRIR